MTIDRLRQTDRQIKAEIFKNNDECKYKRPGKERLRTDTRTDKQTWTTLDDWNLSLDPPRWDPGIHLARYVWFIFVGNIPSCLSFSITWVLLVTTGIYPSCFNSIYRYVRPHGHGPAHYRTYCPLYYIGIDVGINIPKRRAKYRGTLSLKLGAVAYQLGNTSSRTITEVKQRWARLVLGWDTVQVLPECCC